jgi:hypothetical protein
MLKTMLTAVALATLAFAASAHADETKVNCSLLGTDQTPYVCVHNTTDVIIKHITCVGWSTLDINIPEGRIPAGGIWIIKFDSGKCAKEINFFAAGDKLIEQEKGFDFARNADLFISK